MNFSVAGYDAGLVAAYLSAEHGIGLRDGRFCAHPLLKRLGLPAGSLRASFGLGSRLEDAERLLAGLQQLRQNGLGWDYVVDAGRWVPANDTRSYPHWAPNTPGTAGAAPCTAATSAGMHGPGAGAVNSKGICNQQDLPEGDRTWQAAAPGSTA